MIRSGELASIVDACAFDVGLLDTHVDTIRPSHGEVILGAEFQETLV